MVVQRKNITKMTWRFGRSVRHFYCVLLGINIFCHTYISLYRFLYIFWYITMSNYASIKNNWYKSYVTAAMNASGRYMLWRHHIGPLSARPTMAAREDGKKQREDGKLLSWRHNTTRPIAFVALVTYDFYQLFFIEA